MRRTTVRRGIDGPPIVAVFVAWVVALLVALAFWGVVIWGIVEVVQWLTSK